jgi:serine/threonine protein kinase
MLALSSSYYVSFPARLVWPEWLVNACILITRIVDFVGQCQSNRTSFPDFKKEVDASMCFSHQNRSTCLMNEQVYGLCIMEDGCPGIVTEYLPGTLLSIIEQCSRNPGMIASHDGPGSAVPYPLICSVGRQLVETLQFLHKQKVRLEFNL